MQRFHENIMHFDFSLSVFKEIVFKQCISNTDSAKHKKKNSYDPVIALHLEAGWERFLIRNQILQKENYERGHR